MDPVVFLLVAKLENNDLSLNLESIRITMYNPFFFKSYKFLYTYGFSVNKEYYGYFSNRPCTKIAFD